MSIASSIMNDLKSNYNQSVKDMHYRVSLQRHACVLSYNPGLKGYNYLPWEQLFLSNDDVKKAKEDHLKENEKNKAKRLEMIKAHLDEQAAKGGELNIEKNYEYRDSFLGDDKRLVQNLLRDNKSGYQVYFFDAVGCSTKRWLFSFSKTEREKKKQLPLSRVRM